jgi:hypothetical protein
MTPDDLDRLIDEYQTLSEHAAKITAELEAVKEQLRALPAGKHRGQGGTVIISPPHRKLDLEKAASALPPEVRQGCYVPKLDRDAVLRLIGPAIKEWAMEPGDGRPIVRVD